MTDRNVEFPTRYKLTKVAGTDDIYDLTPVPGTVTAEGTLINKETLLSDPTAAALGLTQDDPTVDDALKKLSNAAFIQKTGGEPILTPVTPNFNVGDIVNFALDNGVLPCYVAQIGYPEAGNGNILFRTVNILDTAKYFGLNNQAEYANGEIDNYLNGTFFDTLLDTLQSAIATVSIPYTAMQAGTTVTTISRKVFAHSLTEAGLSYNETNVEGSKIALYDTSIIPYNTAERTWTRSPRYDGTNYARSISTSGAAENMSTTTYLRFFAYFAIPESTEWCVDSDGNYYAAQQYTDVEYVATNSKNEIIGGFTAIETGSYVGTGTYGSSNKNSLTFSFAPRLVILYAYYSVSGTPRVNSLINSTNATCVMSADILNDHSESNYSGFTLSSSTPSYGSKTTDGKTFTWYNSSSAQEQCNISSYTYYYIAIG